MDVVRQLLGMGRRQPGKPLHMLAHGLVVLFHIGLGNQRLDGLTQ